MGSLVLVAFRRVTLAEGEVMTEQEFLFSVFALVRNVIYLVIALVIMFAMFELLFRYMNAQLGINFKEHAWDVIKTSPEATALYFGLRILGVFIACGLVASAFLK